MTEDEDDEPFPPAEEIVYRLDRVTDDLDTALIGTTFRRLTTSAAG